MRMMIVLGLLISLTLQPVFSDEGPSLNQTERYISSMIEKFGACETLIDGTDLYEGTYKLIFNRREPEVSVHDYGEATDTYNPKVRYYGRSLQEFNPQQVNRLDIKIESEWYKRTFPCANVTIYLYCGEVNVPCIKHSEESWSSRHPEREKRTELNSVGKINLTDREVAEKVADAIIHYWNLNGWEMKDFRVPEDLF